MRWHSCFWTSYMTLMVYIPASICNSHDFTLNISMYILKKVGWSCHGGFPWLDDSALLEKLVYSWLEIYNILKIFGLIWGLEQFRTTKPRFWDLLGDIAIKIQFFVCFIANSIVYVQWLMYNYALSYCELWEQKEITCLIIKSLLWCAWPVINNFY